MSGITYQSAGVDYDVLDQFKRHCQRAAATTTGCLAQHGASEPAGIRGESAYLIETADAYWAHVEEGLGTKNLVADAMLSLTGRSFYHAIGVDTVATIVNDLITVGALPISVAMHLACGDAAWLSVEPRSRDLAEGFAAACLQSGAVWGGGETPALKGIVNDDAVVLAGSAFGAIKPKSLRIMGDVQEGDAIVLLASSGVQTNGLSLCRKLVERLPQGYLTLISDGRTYGEALLDASIIYAPFIRACQQAGLPLHYAAHVTGHGWRKLMRLAQPWLYQITRLPPVPAVFPFIAEHAKLGAREMYGSFNMGAGFAVYLPAVEAAKAVAIAANCGISAWECGSIQRQGERKAVVIEPLGIAFEGDTLQLRG